MEVLGCGAVHGDGLVGTEGVAYLLGGVGCLGGTGEGEGVTRAVGPAYDDELVVTQWQGAGEVAEGVIGASIVTVLGTLVDGCGAFVEYEGEEFEVRIVGDTGGSGRCFHGAVVESRGKFRDTDVHQG